MFVDEGFEAFSMRRLADRVGYSPASIYLHFENKDAIFQTLVEESFKGLLKAQQEAAALAEDSGPVETLKRGLRSYVRFGIEHPNEYRLAFLMPSAKGSRPQSASSSFDSLCSRVRKCEEAGLLRPIDPEFAAQSLWVAVHGVTSLLIVKPNFPWVDQNLLIEQVIQSAVQGIMAPEM
jgi:AcrR family transcriptional regulator